MLSRQASLTTRIPQDNVRDNNLLISSGMRPTVPAEPLWDVFTPEVIADLQQARSPTDLLKWRLAILHAGGLNPSPLNQELRAFKAD
jgi:hypothetical protein